MPGYCCRLQQLIDDSCSVCLVVQAREVLGSHKIVVAVVDDAAAAAVVAEDAVKPRPQSHIECAEAAHMIADVRVSAGGGDGLRRLCEAHAYSVKLVEAAGGCLMERAAKGVHLAPPWRAKQRRADSERVQTDTVGYGEREDEVGLRCTVKRGPGQLWSAQHHHSLPSAGC